MGLAEAVAHLALDEDGQKAAYAGVVEVAALGGDRAVDLGFARAAVLVDEP